MLNALANMCKILGDQFVQYLPIAIKPVLRAASMDYVMVFIDGECVTDHVIYCTSLCTHVQTHTYVYAHMHCAWHVFESV